MAELERRLDDGALWLTLNRPERKNAVSPGMREAIIDALAQARADDAIRCVVLTGAGDAFCAGVDLGGGGGSPGVHAIRDQIAGGIQRAIRAIVELEKPVLAAVNGVAAGGGAQLALACDLVVAAESARFIEVFSKRGLAVDSGGAWILPRLVGLARAKELVFFGDAISASEAAEIGLVNRVVPDGDLAKAAGEWASRLARSATRALGASKRLLNRSMGQSLDEALAEEATEQSLVTRTEDFAEGMRAFAEKRDPDFKGR